MELVQQMTYSVHQHWDPLKVCVVGRSYPPEFYSWIESPRLRSLFERIAIETEEDFQGIIKVLKKFNVKVVRPDTPKVLIDDVITSHKRIPGPISMNPRDQMIMIGERFFLFPYRDISKKTSGRNIPGGYPDWTPEAYDAIKGESWPQSFTEFDDLPAWIQEEIRTIHTGAKTAPLVGENYQEIEDNAAKFNWWQPILNEISHNNNVLDSNIITNFTDSMWDLVPANGITRIGKDLYFGCSSEIDVTTLSKNIAERYFADYRCHFITTGGHIDGCFTPVKPGLIVSIFGMPTYKNTFPGWEVVHLRGESWSKVKPFLDLKEKNQGRWWIKGREYDTELIDYVETWLRDWVGYAEESVFDVNILAIDEKNIIVNGYNKQAFDAFSRHGITPHICPVRHRYFWDGGVHCITADLHREGTLRDYFPERNV